MDPLPTEPGNSNSEEKGGTPPVPENQEGMTVQPVRSEEEKIQLPAEQGKETEDEKKEKIEDVKNELNDIYAGTESKESHEFTVEEIRGLLKKIDGKEHLHLDIKERVENIKGELMSMTFSTDEREKIEGVEYEISYQLTLAGQRYKKDGTPGRMVTQTFLTKDYDDGMEYSDQMADHVDGQWTNLLLTAHADEQQAIEGPKETIETAPAKEIVIASLLTNPQETAVLIKYLEEREKGVKSSLDTLNLNVELAEIYRDANLTDAAREAYRDAIEQAWQERQDDLHAKLVAELEKLG